MHSSAGNGKGAENVEVVGPRGFACPEPAKATADLRRVKGPRSHTSNNLNSVGEGAAIQALSVRAAEIAQGKFKITPKRGAMTFDGLKE